MPERDAMRFDVPLYTVADASRIVGTPTSTVQTWVRGYVRRGTSARPSRGEPLITHTDVTNGRDPSIPFVGLAEILVLAAVRRSGVAMQRIRPALQRLQQDLGVEHALASRKLYTDGAELLFDYGGRDSDADDLKHLVVVRNGQRVFTEVVASYLQRIEYASDGYATLIHVPVYERARVVADPHRAFGAPVFERGGVRVDDVLQRFWAGDGLDDVIAEFGVPGDQLEDVLRVASRPAA